MHIHEYQAKTLLSRYEIPLASGGIAYTPQEAEEVAQKLGGSLFAVKAQIHAGGRGKSGGIRMVHSPREVREATQDMLHKSLITPQTRPEGQIVRRVYIEAGSSIARHFYLSLTIDRSTNRILVLASPEGGIDIEELIQHAPKKLTRIYIDPAIGYQPFQGRLLARHLECMGLQAQAITRILSGLYKAFIQLDAQLIEINPLVLTESGTFLALDAKMSFDDNAIYRHKDLLELRDASEEDPAEREASKRGFNYIRLKGNIGCMVNGAGLAMATMDILQHYGGKSANFLDVGGSADRKRVTDAFKILLADPKVEGVLVNIFAGIMRCDIIADGIVAAAREIGLTIPLVVRLQGTNVDIGQKILRESGLPVINTQHLAEAAEKIVRAVQQGY